MGGYRAGLLYPAKKTKRQETKGILDTGKEREAYGQVLRGESRLVKEGEGETGGGGVNLMGDVGWVWA